MTPGPDSDTGPAGRQVEFYWRRGCGFCRSLRRGFDHAGVELVDHDIWADDDARAFVRSVARGNETVPTVVAAGVALVNPSAAEVVARPRRRHHHRCRGDTAVTAERVRPGCPRAGSRGGPKPG